MPPLIGILGGSFNPAHSGHLYLSKQAKTILALDRIVWLVANHNPFKPEALPFAERYESAQKISAHTPWIHVEDLEYRHQTANSFSSINLFLQKNRNTQCVLLMGADVFSELDRWYRAEALLCLLPIAIAPRPGYRERHSRLSAQLAPYIIPASQIRSLPQQKAPYLGFLPMQHYAISSTALRGSINENP